MIIKGGSYENTISKPLVKALGLHIVAHPKPYKIGWITKGSKLIVYETCKVQFSIRKYY